MYGISIRSNGFLPLARTLRTRTSDPNGDYAHRFMMSLDDFNRTEKEDSEANVYLGSDPIDDLIALGENFSDSL
jgi:hypothetical protein